MTRRTKDMLAGFALGFTFYPFPVWIPGGAFAGWSDRKLSCYFAGLMASVVAIVLGVFLFIFLGAYA